MDILGHFENEEQIAFLQSRGFVVSSERVSWHYKDGYGLGKRTEEVIGVYRGDGSPFNRPSTFEYTSNPSSLWLNNAFEIEFYQWLKEQMKVIK